MSEAHKKKRRILQWAFPERLAAINPPAWDGIEDYQVFLDRQAVWSGPPVSAAEIAAKEADYDAHMVIVSKPTVISYEAFQDRFTAAEFKAVTAFVVSKAATNPEYLQTILMRKNVNLIGNGVAAFMAALVAGKVFGDTATPEGLAAAEARKAEILTP